MEDKKNALALSKGHEKDLDNILTQNIQNTKNYKNLNFDPLDKINPESTEWLFEECIPLGSLTILAGQPGVGKTTTCCKILAHVTKGGNIFDLSIQKGSAIFYSSEDSYSQSILHKLAVAGADLSKIDVLNDPDFEPAKDIDAFFHNLEEKYINKPDSDLKVIMADPIHEFVSGDSNKASNVSIILKKISQFVEKHNIAFIGIHHFSKNSNESSYMDRVIGSMQYAAKARVVLVIDCNDKGENIMGIAKSNYSRKDRSIQFKIEPRVHKYDDSDELYNTSEVVFTQYDEYLSIEEAMAGKKNSKWEVRHKQYAEKYEDFVRQNGGKCLAVDIEKALVPNVFETSNMLRRAKEKSKNVQTKKIGNDWFCVLTNQNN